mgnify:CR=1 FL=1
MGRDGALRTFLHILRDIRGATAVEYGLILALIFLAVVGAIGTFSATTINMWDDVSEKVSSS